MSDGVVLSRSADVVRLTLSRAEKGNAYDQAMLDGIADALRRVAADPSVRAVELCGTGRHFCVGADIGSLTPGHGTAGAGIADVCDGLRALDVPTLAIVEGACIGGGLAMVASCDIVMADAAAYFSLPELRLGFVPGPLLPVIARAIGVRALRRMLLTGGRYSAAQLARWGLLDMVTAPGGLDVARMQCIDDFSLAEPEAAARTKRVLRRMEPALSADFALELQAAVAASAISDAAVEGRTAFRERRRPRWASRT